MLRRRRVNAGRLRQVASSDRSNLVGLWTLYRREVRRFLSVSAQTIGGPVVASLLLFAVFGAALSERAPATGAVHYLTFIAPGLVMMGIAQNAFANTSSSLLVAKLQGNIVDLLMAPLSPAELLTGLALGGVTRGLLVGALTLAATSPFVEFDLPNPATALLFAVGGALLFSLMGIVAGLWARRMDEQGAVTSFVIAPITLLSGTFFAAGALPEPLRQAALLDPFLYVVDGFRSGLTGTGETSPVLGVFVVIASNTLLAILCHRLVRAGWRLKQ